MTASRITAEQFKQVLREGMPSAAALPFEVLALEEGRAVLRMATSSADLRPGGTVAGPVRSFADHTRGSSSRAPAS